MGTVDEMAPCDVERALEAAADCAFAAMVEKAHQVLSSGDGSPWFDMTWEITAYDDEMKSIAGTLRLRMSGVGAEMKAVIDRTLDGKTEIWAGSHLALTIAWGVIKIAEPDSDLLLLIKQAGAVADALMKRPT